MAIGIALLLGFNFPQNFNRPYSAEGLRDFWRRWHMTLSRWLRDYLYIPLGGNRKGQTRTSVNLLATMVLGGLWHGAAWTFLAWGTLHGLGLVAEHRLAARREQTGRKPSLPGWASKLLAVNFVVFAWIFFRATSFGDAFDVIGRVFSGWGAPGAASLGAIAVIAAVFAIQQIPSSFGHRAMVAFSRVHWAAQGVALGVFLMVAGALSPAGVAPFIYFQF
jgi:D-alanyl-lipoteichoic acid acyltransferase DltB (MBOAT superfamily)